MYFVKYCCSCNVFGGTVKVDEEKKEEDIFSYLKRYLLLLVFINIGKYSWIDLATKFSIGKLAKKITVYLCKLLTDHIIVYTI